MTLNEIRALIAESDKTGRPIQYKHCGKYWINLVDGDVSFGAPASDYRVAPSESPKPREWWVNGGVAIEGGMREPDHYRRNGYVLTREVMEGEKL